jgi:predicted O-linked N-acetylglucosamine transferase (SPINDLY family)
VNDLPALTAGRITFACLNNFAKLSESTLHLFAQVLERVHNSRLLLHASEGLHRERPRQILASYGIDLVRLEFLPRLSLTDFLAAHHAIDIAIDPFPFGGGTTSCDALFMGVPLVTLRGELPVSRAGASLLSALDLPELIADTPARYVEIATTLANDMPRLQGLRQTLRDRMRRSRLSDATGFTRALESIYRTLWQGWCRNPA